ncbi:unnamed protein product [Dovyalis caffra]|uniref:Uncharacterized protein n=1 Tax=Dovyalis caffra TaxID=77055 RepID=A0AAV1S0T2_9ROSI|nr:unnamed protein product [Dovyalis caffra]
MAIMDDHLEEVGQDSGTVRHLEFLPKLSLALPCLMEEIKDCLHKIQAKYSD